MATSGPRFAASFDGRAWSEDVWERYAEGSSARRVAEATRREFERRGVPRDALQACEEEGRDRSQLAGCVKAYLPLGERRAEERPFGMVFALVVREERPVLEFVAFGVRHQPRGSRAPTV